MCVSLILPKMSICFLDYSSHFSAGLSEMLLWEQARSWSLQHAVPSFLTGRPFLFWHGYACPIYTKHACTCLVKVQSIYGNSRRVKVTRCPWSNVALTTFIYYLRHWRHCTLAQTCLTKVQSIYGTGGQRFAHDLPHQRKRWPQPFIIHVMTHTPDPAWPKSNLFMVTGGGWKMCDVCRCQTLKVARRRARACRTYF